MKVVVTGGAGFIGANLCRELARRGAEVLVLDDLSTGRRANLDGLDVELRVQSVLDRDAVVYACAGADTVVHLAAVPSVTRSLMNPRHSHDVNVTGSLEVLEAACAAGAHVVLASSSSVYGRNPALPKSEEMACVPVSPYASGKLAAESYALSFQHCFDLPCTVFRFFNVFGPLQLPDHPYAAVIPTFIWSALRGQPLTVFGDGEQTRDFTFVDSVVGVLADSVLRSVSCTRPVNLAFGTRTSLNDVVALLSALLGRKLEVARRPQRAGDVRHSQASGTSLRRLFPQARPVSLEMALSRTIEWVERLVRTENEAARSSV
ncbi:NAD-dependent epimerase/dehydratase family protein [Lentzea tibetensis]|uniref:NAD-dependent epimerase/dehydratase family protein n=1 Tax=Lentzea tibetensis TaxID=2591470 RepID=A0A563EZ60_9PSEU|nr:NAD-dependent epimerase/dehydratase family protein [Lentzea tibetensis]TWP52414.1 NAD-dependent epimerase/dehydratase family protein [Lentzea tibetensis]